VTALVMTLLMCHPMSAPTQGTDGARDIMRRVLRDSRAEDEVVSVTMQLLDASGRVRRRTATFYSKKRTAENSVRLIRFLTPPEFARSGIKLEWSKTQQLSWLRSIPTRHNFTPPVETV